MKLSPADRAALFGTRKKDDKEDRLQTDLVEHIQWRKKPGVIVYMIRNHGKRGRASLGKDRAMGLLNGAGDLGFVIPPHGQAAFLELKQGDNTPSKDQDQFGVDCEAAGALYAVAWDIDTALRILTAWGVLQPA